MKYLRTASLGFTESDCCAFSRAITVNDYIKLSEKLP